PRRESAVVKLSDQIKFLLADRAIKRGGVVHIMPPSIFWREAGQFLRAHTSAFSIISIDALGLQLAHCSIRDSLPPQSQFDRFLSHGQTLSAQGSYYSALPPSMRSVARPFFPSSTDKNDRPTLLPF